MHRIAMSLPTVATAALIAACAGARPPATTAAAATADPAPRDSVATVPARRGYVAADVRFMQDMIAHHAQALAMVAMVPTHGAGDAVRLAAERIDVTQRDEIALMQRWLRRRGEAAPEAVPEAAHAHHAAGAATMPGMLSPAELARLDAARGTDFDRLFLASMIRHHEGALAMVRDYLAMPGAAQETEIFRFSSDVDADQRAEIRRMRALLDRLAP
jgi:uncharacterized protein (DUF305 family)